MKGRGASRLVSHLLSAGLAATVLTAAWAGAGATAGATPTTTTTTPTAAAQAQINATQAKVNGIEATIAQEQQQSQLLSEEYDAAQQQVQLFQSELASTEATMSRTRAAIARDRAQLASDALKAYISGSAGTQAPSLFTTSTETSSKRLEYEHTAIGNLAATRAALDTAQAKLAVAEANQRDEAKRAQEAAAHAQVLQQQNAAATAAAQATLQQVKGTLASEVAAAARAKAEREAAAAAAAKKAAAARAAAAAAAQAAAVARQFGGTDQAATNAANQAVAAAGGPQLTTNGVSSGPSSGTGSGLGAAALRAAESQLGVPYVWGGETPKGGPGNPTGGFDCSGLTQWAWAQAGVSIPRTSQTQYATLTRVWTIGSSSGQLVLSSLRPGDLFLYDNLDGTGTVDHVAMYAGGDTLIQAPFTGTVVRYVTVFTGGLVAVARP